MLARDSTYYAADFMELLKKQFYNIKQIPESI